MKKAILILAVIFTSTLLFANPTEVIVKTFTNTFPGAQNVKWHEDAGGYLVSFTNMGKFVKINYDKDGQFVSALRYYDEKDLPMNILLAVKKHYAAETITGVTEVTTTDGVAFLINLEDAKKWSVVKADTDGLLEMQKSYKKA